METHDHDAERFAANDGNHPCGHPRIEDDAWLECRTCTRMEEAAEARAFEVEVTRTITTTHTAWILVTAKDSEEALDMARARDAALTDAEWTEDNESSPGLSYSYRVYADGEEVDSDEDDFRR